MTRERSDGIARGPERGAAQAQAMARFAVLRPHLEEGVPLARAAADAGVPLRTAQRWLARYRRDGLAGLARPVRSDAGARRLARGLVALVEGLGLKRPRSSAAAIHRRVRDVATARGWRAPSYGTVHAILSRLDPAMVTLAQDGPAAYRDRYELIHRHRAEAPNALWQADHTLLDVLVLDESGKPARPGSRRWSTTTPARSPGYMVFLGAPSVLNTCLALRHAIWRKADPAWPVCGIPDVLYVDHGSDFTSSHLDQVAAALRFRVVYSAVGRPQGRGKVERLFGTLNTELLPELPGHLVGGKPATPPRAVARGAGPRRSAPSSPAPTTPASTARPARAPLDAWRGHGFLPRLPESLEELDLLLVMHAKPRVVRRDGIHFEGLRYVSPTLAGYVGEPVTIRYDPRDLSEIRVFHRDRLPLPRGERGARRRGGDAQGHRGGAARAPPRLARRHQRARGAGGGLPAGPRRSSAPSAAGASRPRPARTRLRLYEEDGP